MLFDYDGACSRTEYLRQKCALSQGSVAIVTEATLFKICSDRTYLY